MLVGYINMGRCRLMLVRRGVRTDDCYGNGDGRVWYERTLIAISARYTITYEVGENVVRYGRKCGACQYYGKLWRDVHLHSKRSFCRQRHTCLVEGGRVDQATREWWKKVGGLAVNNIWCGGFSICNNKVRRNWSFILSPPTMRGDKQALTGEDTFWCQACMIVCVRVYSSVLR